MGGIWLSRPRKPTPHLAARWAEKQPRLHQRTPKAPPKAHVSAQPGDSRSGGEGAAKNRRIHWKVYLIKKKLVPRILFPLPSLHNCGRNLSPDWRAWVKSMKGFCTRYRRWKCHSKTPRGLALRENLKLAGGRGGKTQFPTRNQNGVGFLTAPMENWRRWGNALTPRRDTHSTTAVKRKGRIKVFADMKGIKGSLF